MGKPCQICAHPDRAAIELGLANNVSIKELMERHAMNKMPFYRHRRFHMTPDLLAGLKSNGRLSAVELEQLRAEEKDAIMQTLLSARVRILRKLDHAESSGDPVVWDSAMSKLLQHLSLAAKINGQLKTGTQTVNNFLVLPAYAAFRAAVVYALRPYPDAQQAVIDAIQSIEGKYAKEIEVH